MQPRPRSRLNDDDYDGIAAITGQVASLEAALDGLRQVTRSGSGR